MASDRKPNTQCAIPLNLGGRAVGPGLPVYVVAEIGVNHQGDPALALRLVDAAAKAGADAVKLQKRCLEKLYVPDVLENTARYERPYQYLIPILKKVELPEEAHRRIAAYARERGLDFLCSAFDLPSADFVDSLGVPAFKVASCDLTNLPLLEHLAGKGKPLIVSTGASELREIAATVRRLRRCGARFILLHCTSVYPARLEDTNLRFLERLARFGAPVGYSGHETSATVPAAAAALGACLIEKHITLSRQMEGPDHRASLEPPEFEAMVKAVREVERALGRPCKHVSQGELINREVLGKSLVAAAAIPKGARITRKEIEVRSPAKGISPQWLPKLVGRRAVRDIRPGEFFLETDLGLTTPPEAAGRPAFGKWGVIVRFTDAEDAALLRPRVLEFHLTSADVEVPGRVSRLPVELVVHAPEYDANRLVDLCTPRDGPRGRSIEFVGRVMGLTASLAPYFVGRPKLVVHPGGMSLDGLTNGTRARMQAAFEDSFCELRTRARRAGVELLLENLPPLPWYFGGQWRSHVFVEPEEVVRFADETGAAICLDLSHAQLACAYRGGSLRDFVRAVQPYVRHLHIADARGVNGEGVQIGEGDIDFPQVLSELRGYRESWVPEIWRGHLNGRQGFRVALDRIAKLLAGSGAPGRAAAAAPALSAQP